MSGVPRSVGGHSGKCNTYQQAEICIRGAGVVSPQPAAGHLANIYIALTLWFVVWWCPQCLQSAIHTATFSTLHYCNTHSHRTHLLTVIRLDHGAVTLCNVTISQPLTIQLILAPLHWQQQQRAVAVRMERLIRALIDNLNRISRLSQHSVHNNYLNSCT